MKNGFLLTHAEIIERYNVPGKCVVRECLWPYECEAKHKHPDDVVYICDTHSVWWHEGLDPVITPCS